MRQCSTRDYEGAIDGCLQGYGIKHSSVSRHWKAATAEDLDKVMQRPVPPDLNQFPYAPGAKRRLA